MTNDEVWVPEACTLPTTEQPLRIAEFDRLFTEALRRKERLTPTHLQWQLDPAEEQTVRDLTVRETACCSFFTFTVVPAGATLLVDVQVPTAHIDVLDALAGRAAAALAA